MRANQFGYLFKRRIKNKLYVLMNILKNKISKKNSFNYRFISELLIPLIV